MGIKKIKVLFVSHDGGMAGAQMTLLTLLKNIDRSQFEPFLIVPYGGGALSIEAEKLNISVFICEIMHWIPCADSVYKHSRLLHILRFFKTLRARYLAIYDIILSQNIDIVYTNTVTCIEGALAAKITHKPHIWHIHEFIRGNLEVVAFLPFSLYVGFMGLFSRSFLFCSKNLANEYKYLKSKSNVIYNGLFVPDFVDKKKARDFICENFKVEINNKIVMVVGALHPGKDHFTFLKAAKEITLQDNEVTFFIIGDGDSNYRSEIFKKVKSLGLTDHVKLIGQVPSVQVQSLLAGADVLVVSSKQETFGLTLIEALAVETPVVSTKCGGPEEIIENEKSGLLVPIGGFQEMSKAILFILNNQEIAKSFGRTGRNVILNKFSLDKYINGIQKVLIQSLN